MGEILITSVAVKLVTATLGAKLRSHVERGGVCVLHGEACAGTVPWSRAASRVLYMAGRLVINERRMGRLVGSGSSCFSRSTAFW
jgi:hypothetical protein